MATQNQPKVYIVTINWNGLKDTLECLESLRNIDYKNFKTVVIDNDSKDGQAVNIKRQYSEIKLIENQTNKGFTGACNQGVELAIKDGADYVLLLNNDTVVTKDFLTKIVDFYEARPDAGMASPVVLYNDRKTIWYAGAKLKFGITRHEHKGRPLKAVNLGSEPFKTAFVPGAALLIKTDLIKKIGLLDDKYFAYYEDQDWCYRASQVGRYSYVVPSAIIYHKKSGSTGEGGQSKLNKIPAYFIARNGVLFASNLKGFKKAVYLFNQFAVKLPLSCLLLVKPSAWSSYIKGLYDGARGGRADFQKIFY